MAESLVFYARKVFEIFSDLSAFVVAYFSVAGSAFISYVPFHPRLGSALFFGLNLLMFLWILSLIFNRRDSLKNTKIWLCALAFAVFEFLLDDKALLCAIFLLISGFYLCISRDSLVSLKLFERLRIKFNQQRSKYESTN